MLDLPDALIAEKNKLASDSVDIDLLEIQLSESGETLRYTNNNENVVWGGYTWIPFPFEPGDHVETAEGELPTVTIKVANAERVIQGLIEESTRGLVKDRVIYRLVHSEYLELEAFITTEFEILGTRCEPGDEWITFTLGAENFFFRRFPLNTLRVSLCNYQVFKNTQCGYTGAETECDRTFSRCIELGNHRFGGQPGLLGHQFDL